MIWNLLFLVAGLLFLAFTVHCLFVYAARKREKDKRIVHLFNLLLFTGIGVSLVFFILLSLYVFRGEKGLNNTLGIGACSLFLLLGLVSMIAWHNCVISYDDQGFISKTFFGKKRTFSYRDITGYYGQMDTYLFCGKHKIAIDGHAKNKEEFLSLANQKYRAIHHGHTIPFIKKRFDIFNGHVEHSTEILTAYLVVFGFLAACFALVLFTSFRTVNEQNTQYFTTAFTGYKVDDDDLWLYPAEGDTPFVVRQYLEKMEQIDALFPLCNGQTAFHVYAERSPSSSKSKEETSYLVWNLSDSNGRTFLSFENAMSHRTDNLPLVCTVFGIITLTWAAFVVCSIIVGRNPKKYGRRIVRLFFKDGYIH